MVGFRKGQAMEIVSKSEAARKWQVTPTAVGKYVRAGMPVRNDGRLDFAIADKWRRDNVVSQRSGSFNARQRKKQSACAAAIPAADHPEIILQRKVREAITPVLSADIYPEWVTERIKLLMLADAMAGLWQEDREDEQGDFLPFRFAAFAHPERAAAAFRDLRHCFDELLEMGEG